VKRGRTLLAGVLLPALLGASSGPPPITPKERTKLQGGGVIVRFGDPPGGKGVVATSIGLVDGSPARVFPAVRDCGRFAEIFPRIQKSSVLPEDGGTFICDVTIDLPFPLKNPRSLVRSTVEELPGGGYRRSYVLTDDPSDYHRNEGYWAVYPWGGGKRSLVVNHMSNQTKQTLPETILRAAQERTAPESFEALRDYVGRLPIIKPAPRVPVIGPAPE
jgi:hypothetical protein